MFRPADDVVGGFPLTLEEKVRLSNGVGLGVDLLAVEMGGDLFATLPGDLRQHLLGHRQHAPRSAGAVVHQVGPRIDLFSDRQEDQLRHECHGIAGGPMLARLLVVLLVEAPHQFLENRPHPVVVKTRLLDRSIVVQHRLGTQIDVRRQKFLNQRAQGIGLGQAGIWFRNSNFSRISWTFGEKPMIYLSADQEETYRVAQANSELDYLNQFTQDRVELRLGENYIQESPESVDFMDVSPMQIMSVSAALIPFLEHDDANRALMGSNMQRQAVPLLRPQAPTVGTGMESRVARDSGQVVMADVAGVVTSVTGREIVVTDEDGIEHPYPMIKFSRTNQGTCFDQRPLAENGDLVQPGDILADSSSTDHGELALGQNVLVAFMSWEGYNYEDAIIISERLVKDDYFTSTHIEKHEMEARETKLGPEEITRDIPNVGEASLRDLDERGIIRVGADVGPGDILVGKVTPKGETELTAEEKLLRAIFGEKSRDVKDTSLRVPHGERGKVIDVKVLNRTNRDDLPPGVNEAVRVWIAQTRKIAVGDKVAGRHGNKGVIARILPEEDMPFLPDGSPRGSNFEPPRSSFPYESGPGAGNPPGVGSQGTQLPGQHSRFRRRQRCLH